MQEKNTAVQNNSSTEERLEYSACFDQLMEQIEINLSEERFVYFIDYKCSMNSLGKRFDNFTPNYCRLLQNGLINMKYVSCDNKFCKDYNNVIDSIIKLIERIIESLEKVGSCSEKIEWFRRMKEHPAAGFYEAIQRVLFVNQLFWQTGHKLIGLGALDSYLLEYYRRDIDNNILTKEDVYSAISDVFRILHSDYKYKSNLLLGDTGQIAVIGKSNTSGEYIYNDLTEIVLRVIKELNQPEPKCVLRVNRNIPNELLQMALESIKTGNGSPLFANDERIIESLLDFGVDKEDAYEYVTSACWEPTIAGKSTSQNNITALNYVRALDNLLRRERVEKISSFEMLMDKYCSYLRRNIRSICRVIGQIRMQYDPLLSIFMEGCFENRKDVSHGGAVYHNVGITSVGMGNLIDSLLNIKELVFEKEQLSLIDVKKATVLNYENYSELKSDLKQKKSAYGLDKAEVIELTRKISQCAADELSQYCIGNDSRLKIGLSGSAYMDAGKRFNASFDGRGAGQPFIVHISNEKANGFTEVLNFSAQMDYKDAQFNGNVVDVMISPDFIDQNFEKMMNLVKAAIKVGFFEFQMNVVSSKILIEAKEKPELWPGLIVRVWGFSAYFNDLPTEYKNLLIERAIANEVA